MDGGEKQPARAAAAAATGLLLALLAPRCFAEEAPGPHTDDAVRSWAQQVDSLPPPAAEPGKAWWQEVMRALPNCREYTDGCRLCSGRADGLVCSTPGIACTPSAWTCARPR